jgi:hypothetical protein
MYSQDAQPLVERVENALKLFDKVIGRLPKAVVEASLSSTAKSELPSEADVNAPLQRKYTYQPSFAASTATPSSGKQSLQLY